MSIAERARPVSAAEAAGLFAGLERAEALVLAVSGGPDSTALLLIASRWRRSLNRGPALLAVTVDHGLRPEAREEALAVKRIARQCGLAHRVLRWTGKKPATGLQARARAARYRLLGEAAARFGAAHVLTAHTLDDQAETVLIRMSRGSGLTGLRAMAASAPLPGGEASGIALVRPLLGVPKARLVATLAHAGLAFADDPSNRDPRFTRARLRALMPALAREGLTAARLAQLARRIARAEAAIEAAVDAAWAAQVRTAEDGTIACSAAVSALPAEIRLRLIGRAIGQVGDEGPVALGKLEALHAGVTAALAAGIRLRRTLAGAVVTCGAAGGFTVARAPARRGRNQGPRKALNHRQTLLPQSQQSAVK